MGSTRTRCTRYLGWFSIKRSARFDTGETDIGDRQCPSRIRLILMSSITSEVISRKLKGENLHRGDLTYKLIGGKKGCLFLAGYGCIPLGCRTGHKIVHDAATDTTTRKIQFDMSVTDLPITLLTFGYRGRYLESKLTVRHSRSLRYPRSLGSMLRIGRSVYDRVIEVYAKDTVEMLCLKGVSG